MNAIINGKNVTFEAGETILAVAQRNGFFIPTLCAFQPLGHKPGVCRVCLVECTPPSGNVCVVPACVTPMEDGMRVETSTPALLARQRMQVELLLAEHRLDCDRCARRGDCELQRLRESLGLDAGRPVPQGEKRPEQALNGIVRDMDKCVRCLRCVTMCRKQGPAALRADSSGREELVIELTESACVRCGQCARVCPVGALDERDDVSAALNMLTSPDLFTVVAFTASARDALKSAFSSADADLEGRLIASLRHLGADAVINADFVASALAASVSEELAARLREKRDLPLFSAACPAWAAYAQSRLPGLRDRLSAARAPQILAAALKKSELAQRYGVAEEKMRLLLVTPCTAMKDNDNHDFDAVLSARELARLMNLSGLCPDDAAPESFDPFPSTEERLPYGGQCGELAGDVLRALRAPTRFEGLPRPFPAMPGDNDVLEAEADLGDLGVVRVALCFTCAAAEKLAAQALEGRSPYAFVETLACPGGCAQGGGSGRIA